MTTADEDIQDRLGAQGAYDAAAGRRQEADPWLELAALLCADPAAGGAPSGGGGRPRRRRGGTTRTARGPCRHALNRAPGGAAERASPWRGGRRDRGGGRRRVGARHRSPLAERCALRRQRHAVAQGRAVSATARAALRQARDESRARNSTTREALPDDAVSIVPAAPEVEDPPAPPPSNPVPEHTRRVLQLSDRRLPDQTTPALVPSIRREVENGVTVGGSLPRLGEQPVSSALFQTLTTPGAAELAQLPRDEIGPDGQINPEARDVRLALEQLASTGEPAARQGRGEPVVTPDTGPVPMRPLPEHLQVRVGQVVARLLAQADQATADVLTNLRMTAYPNGVLNATFPDVP